MTIDQWLMSSLHVLWYSYASSVGRDSYVLSLQRISNASQIQTTPCHLRFHIYRNGRLLCSVTNTDSRPARSGNSKLNIVKYQPTQSTIKRAET